MRVKATQPLYYGNRRIYENQVFTLLPVTVNFDKAGKKLDKPQVITPEQQFTESCMARVTGRDVYNAVVKKKKGSQEVTIPTVVSANQLEEGFEHLDDEDIPDTAPGADSVNQRIATGDQDVI